ncbi:MAG: restriction endonuclease subunit R, partial [Anaerolineae bacterium]
VSSSGTLHLANIKNAAGEIGLRVGTSDHYFGAINIGDDANFLKLAEEAQRDLTIEEEALRGSLFNVINTTTSPITMLLGAKKFSEGWSSWRVSGMGLLNVGRSEGSEIIQMFGRGVRLKGYQYSLKRSTALDGAHPPHLDALETLNIFSIHGDYLTQFKNALDREGIIEGYEEIPVPVDYPLYDPAEQRFGGNGARHVLYTVRVKDDLDFAGQPAFPLEAVRSQTVRPTIDLRPTVQALSSVDSSAAPLTEPPPQKLQAHHLALLNWPDITAEMLAWKRQRGYRNMAITQAALRAVLDPANDCYTLHAPDEYLELASFNSIPRLQNIALTILKQYADRFYKETRKAWERPQLEYRPLTTSDDNLKLAELPDGRAGYIVKINRGNPDLIKKIQDLINTGRDMYEKDVAELQNIHFDRHLYLPLFTATHFNQRGQVSAGHPDLKFVPTGLVESETRFVHRLREFLTANPNVLGQRHLYLLRNLSRGKGVGFFEADNFYPDFILWLIDDQQQHIIFVDPKGLGHIFDGFKNKNSGREPGRCGP